MNTEEWSQKIREYGMNEWLRNNPGKNKEDYDVNYNQKLERNKQRYAAKEQQKIENTASKIGLFIHKCILYFAIPAIIAWILTLFLPMNYLNAFIAMVIILPIVRYMCKR